MRVLVLAPVATLVTCIAIAAAGDFQDQVPRAGGELSVEARGREAFMQPAPTLPEALRPAFFRGRNLFRQVWVVAPAQDADVDGLGPVYNRLSCLACHAKNGRGFAPDSPGEEMRAVLVRLSIPGTGTHGEPIPHPAYGDQLNELGVPGVPAEGHARIHYRTEVVALSDGETVELRRPVLDFKALRFGPLEPSVMTSVRIAPPVFGLGLLEAVSDGTLASLAKRPGPRSGRPNLVWSTTLGRTVFGRFGAKANQPDLVHQVAGAFIGDLGITSALFPSENCTKVQTDCSKAATGGSPELSPEQMEDVTLYLQMLAVPQRRNVDAPEVRAGERLFESFGCAECHVPRLETGGHPTRPELSAQTIHPYTDLLLHDMGSGLADGRPDHEANGREWRTAPLWGIGLAERFGERVGYLHDGRARTILEAILWHGGQAADARESVVTATRAERSALLRFLESL